MPMQGPQADSRMRAPAAIRSARRPSRAIVANTWRDPGVSVIESLFDDASAAQDVRRDREVVKRRIGARADADLVKFEALDFAHRHHVVRTVRLRDQWFERCQVDGDVFVVCGIGIWCHGPPRPFAILPSEIRARDLVARKERGRGAQFRAHVADGGTLRNRQVAHAVTVVLENFADAALHGQSPQHFQNDVLGGHPRLPTPDSFTPTTFGIGSPNGPPAIATATSRPPAPIASIPAPPLVGVCESEPSSVTPVRRTVPGALDGRCRCRDARSRRRTWRQTTAETRGRPRFQSRSAACCGRRS